MAPVNSNDIALATGQWAKWGVFEPIHELKAVLASFGLKTTNYIFRDEIKVTEPVIVCVFGKELVEEAQGQTKATEAWLVKILIAPLSAWNAPLARFVTRLVSDKLRTDMPGLKALSETGVENFNKVFDRVDSTGTTSRKIPTIKKREDLDKIAKAKLQERFSEDGELAWTDPAAKDYNREDVDERAPVQQGKAHAVAPQDLVEFFKRLAMAKVDNREKRLAVLKLIEDLPDTHEAWKKAATRDVAELKQVERDAATQGSTIAGGSGTSKKVTAAPPARAAIIIDNDDDDEDLAALSWGPMASKSKSGGGNSRPKAKSRPSASTDDDDDEEAAKKKKRARKSS